MTFQGKSGRDLWIRGMPFGGWGFLLVCLWAKMAAASPPALGTIGEVCSLYEPAPHAGVICQATGEWVVDDAVVLNARKGDLLLNSACGPTARLVDTAVAQKYSHVGIMIEDRSRVRHARVHLKPFEDSIEADGGSESRLKFGWPGVVSQTVQAAYEGSELRPKPPAAPVWTPDFIQLDSHFGSDPDPDPECEDMMLLPPRVIRPPLEFEDQIFAEDGLSVRERLFAVADESVGLTGHYRFYAFTETDIHGRTSGPGADGPETGLETFWEDEVGERHHPKGMQCAAFVWQSTQAAGFSVDDGLPHPVHTDPAVWVYDGDELEHGPADSRGLYVYPEEKRHQGISFLGAVVRKKVADMIALWPGSFLAEAIGVPERLSRQMRACFAFDECGGSLLLFPVPDVYQRLYDGEVGDGLAVSPGDLTHWDAYPHGLWGSTEHLFYRPGVYRQIHRWAASEGSGNLQVTVERGDGTGLRVPGVQLHFPLSVVTPSQQETDAMGYVLFKAVAASVDPAGHTLIARYMDDWNEDPPVQKEKLRPVFVTAGATKSITLLLDSETDATGIDCPPDGLHVRLSGQVDLLDDDVGPDDTGSFEPTEFLYLGEDGSPVSPPTAFSEAAVGALQPLQVAFFGDLGPGYDQACVDEVMTGGQLTLELVTVEGVRAVRASLSASLYEGSSRLGCGYTATGLDLDDFQSTSVLARAGEGPVPLYLSLLNSRRRTSEADRNGGDKATFHLNVEALSCFSPGGSP